MKNCEVENCNDGGSRFSIKNLAFTVLLKESSTRKVWKYCTSVQFWNVVVDLEKSITFVQINANNLFVIINAVSKFFKNFPIAAYSIISGG